MVQCYFKSNLNLETQNETSQPGNIDLCIFCIFILCTYARTVCATDVEFNLTPLYGEMFANPTAIWAPSNPCYNGAIL